MGKRIDLNKNWKLFVGDLAPQSDTDGWGGAKARAYDFGATAQDLNDSNWRTVTLPHDFVVEGDYTKKTVSNNDMTSIPEMESIDSRHMAGGSLEGGIAWYRRHFSLPHEYAGKRIFLHFDGVYRNSTIYINQYYVGDHQNGYTSFYYDITDFINEDEENLIAVRVDSTGREGWWYEGGGIYRNVWLEIKGDVYLPPSGEFVNSSIDVSNKTAHLEIRTELASRLTKDASVRIENRILDADNHIVQCLTTTTTLETWSETEVRTTCDLTDIHLWDLDSPYLYKLETRIYLEDSSVEAKKQSAYTETEPLSDYSETFFGLRSIVFSPDEGLILNGKKISVLGLCCHQDHAGVGIATQKSVLEYRLMQMKKMGANGYRCAHHQPSRELLTICDRIGMLVLDETRRMSSAPRDLEQLRTLVKRDRNHPCIFLWGIGNEEIFCQDRKESIKSTITMRSEIRKLDPTRPITSAVVCWNGKERFEHARAYIPVTKELDVMGFNYCKTAWDDYHKQVPSQPIIITEASANSGTRGCYSTEEEKGHYYIYDKKNFEKCKNGQKASRRDNAESEWRYFADRPYLAGIFLWTGMDYRGEPTPLSYPAISSQFGIFDFCSFPKDNFYYYKSWWTDEPVLHLFPHWNWQGHEGEAFEIFCYSNLDEIELFVNERSYGRKKVEKNWYLSWADVTYEPGTLKAVGYKDGLKVLEDTQVTTKPAHEIILTPYKNVLTSSDDAAIICVSIVDEDGRFVPTADNEITFTVEGSGEFLGVGNGNPGSHEPDTVPVRRAFNGLCQLLVRPTGAGEIHIKATSPGLLPQRLTIEVLK